MHPKNRCGRIRRVKGKYYKDGYRATNQETNRLGHCKVCDAWFEGKGHGHDVMNTSTTLNGLLAR